MKKIYEQDRPIAPPNPPHLRGFSHQQMTNQRGFKGGSEGAANKGRRLSRAEVAKIEAQMRAEGKL